MKIQRVEKHLIKKNHPMHKLIDEYCFRSKNLYNYANYILRNKFIKESLYIPYNDLTKQIKHDEPFRDIGSNSGQHTLKMLDKSWKSFFKSIKDWGKNPSKYLGKPRIPKYKDKNGRHIFVMTNMQSQIKENCLYFAFTPFKPYNNMIRTKIDGKHLQTRFVPYGSSYVLEIVYEKEINVSTIENSENIIGIDLGINNFATIQNNIGSKPIVINGKGLKSINQYYNKKIAKFQSESKKVNDKYITDRMERLTLKRNNKIDYFMHCASKYVADYCMLHKIDTVVIGYNEKWKNSISLGKLNQKFVNIPYLNFISKLSYKLEEKGIKLVINEESYTSKASFIDNDEMKKGVNFSGSRVCRGMYKSNSGQLINADVNGAGNIIRKVFPNIFKDGIEGAGLHPMIVNV